MKKFQRRGANQSLESSKNSQIDELQLQGCDKSGQTQSCVQCKQVPENYIALSCDHNFCLNCLINYYLNPNFCIQEREKNVTIILCEVCTMSTQLDPQSVDAIESCLQNERVEGRQMTGRQSLTQIDRNQQGGNSDGGKGAFPHSNNSVGAPLMSILDFKASVIQKENDMAEFNQKSSFKMKLENLNFSNEHDRKDENEYCFDSDKVTNIYERSLDLDLIREKQQQNSNPLQLHQLQSNQFLNNSGQLRNESCLGFRGGISSQMFIKDSQELIREEIQENQNEITDTQTDAPPRDLSKDQNASQQNLLQGQVDNLLENIMNEKYQNIQNIYDQRRSNTDIDYNKSSMVSPTSQSNNYGTSSIQQRIGGVLQSNGGYLQTTSRILAQNQINNNYNISNSYSNNSSNTINNIGNTNNVNNNGSSVNINISGNINTNGSNWQLKGKESVNRQNSPRNSCQQNQFELRNYSIQAAPIGLVQSCPDHPMEEAVLFCFTCEDYCLCLQCLTDGDKHRNHDVRNISKSGGFLRSKIDSTLGDVQARYDYISFKEYFFAGIQDKIQEKSKEVSNFFFGLQNSLIQSIQSRVGEIISYVELAKLNCFEQVHQHFEKLQESRDTLDFILKNLESEQQVCEANESSGAESNFENPIIFNFYAESKKVINSVMVAVNNEQLEKTDFFQKNMNLDYFVSYINELKMAINSIEFPNLVLKSEEKKRFQSRQRKNSSSPKETCQTTGSTEFSLHQFQVSCQTPTIVNRKSNFSNTNIHCPNPLTQSNYQNIQNSNSNNQIGNFNTQGTNMISDNLAQLQDNIKATFANIQLQQSSNSLTQNNSEFLKLKKEFDNNSISAVSATNRASNIGKTSFLSSNQPNTKSMSLEQYSLFANNDKEQSTKKSFGQSKISILSSIPLNIHPLNFQPCSAEISSRAGVGIGDDNRSTQLGSALNGFLSNRSYTPTETKQNKSQIFSKESMGFLTKSLVGNNISSLSTIHMATLGSSEKKLQKVDLRNESLDLGFKSQTNSKSQKKSNQITSFLDQSINNINCNLTQRENNLDQNEIELWVLSQQNQRSNNLDQINNGMRILDEKSQNTFLDRDSIKQGSLMNHESVVQNPHTVLQYQQYEYEKTKRLFKLGI